MTPKEKGKRLVQPRTIRVEIRGPRNKVNARKVERAIRKKLAAVKTDLFAQDDTLVLLVQHQLGGKRTPE
jgi:hypothetical protein